MVSAEISASLRSLSTRFAMVSSSSSGSRARINRVDPTSASRFLVCLYLGRILDHKFPDDRSRVTVSREGELITLAVQPPEGRRKETEQVIDDYARVLQGGLAPEDFLEDSGEVEQLKFELELLKSRLDSERKTTKLLEGRIRVLQRNLEDLQKRNRRLLPARGLGSITIDIGDKYYVSGQASSIGRGAQARSSRMHQSRSGDR